MPTFTEQVSVTADDGYWLAGGATFNNNANSVSLGPQAGGPFDGFFHFPNVTVPAGATITSASLTMRPTMNGTALHFTINGEKAANPAAVTSAADGDSRARTTAAVTWNTDFTSGTDISTTDLAAIIQEIVNQGGWASGNAMQLFMAESTNGATAIVGEDGTHPAGRVLLTINYTTGGGGGGGGSGAPFWLFED